MYNIMFGIFETSLAISMAIILITFVMKLFKNKLKAVQKHIIWMLLAAALLIPVRLIEIKITEPAPIPQAGLNPYGQILITAEPVYMHPYALLEIWSEFRSGSQPVALHQSRPSSDTSPVNEAPVSVQSSIYDDLHTQLQNTVQFTTEILKEIINSQNLIILVHFALFLLWIGGIMVFAITRISRHIRVIKSMKGFWEEITEPAVTSILDNIQKNLQIKHKIKLMTCSLVTTPVAIGFIRPKIILPVDALEENPDKLRLMLIHEIIHIKRGDLITRVLCFLALAIHWFNPIIHRMMRIISEEAEQATDDAVMRFSGEENRLRYGETLLSLAKAGDSHGNKSSFSYGLTGEGRSIKKRLENITKKRHISRWVWICCMFMLLIITLTFSMLGCSTNSNTDSNPDGQESGGNGGSRDVNWAATVPFDMPEFMYTTERVKISTPAGYGIAGNTNLVGDNIYFSGSRFYGEKMGDEHDICPIPLIDSGIFILNIPTMEVTKLPGYTPIAPSEEVMLFEGAATYMSHVVNMHVDNDENIYIIERTQLVTCSIPEDIDPYRIYFDDHYSLQQYHVIRKLDKTGKDLIEPVDITDFDGSYWQVWEICSDIHDNIYIREWNSLSSRVIIFNPDGSSFTTLDSGNVFPIPYGLIKLPNGNAATVIGEGGDMKLMEIDAETGKWKRTVTLPGSRYGASPLRGTEEYPVSYFRGSALTGYNPDTGEFNEIINLTDAGISYTFLYHAAVLDDGRIMLLIYTIDENDLDYDAVEIVYIKKTPFDSSERTVLTVAAYRLFPEFNEAIAAFNRTSDTHFLQVISYDIYAGSGDDGWMKAIERLSLDITTGKIPDIIFGTYEIPMGRYTEIGLLEDLYPFIDKDSELSRDSFVEGVLEATEQNNGLYKLFPSFFITSIIGNPSVVGESSGWDMDEFLSILTKNPQADMPLGNWETRDSFFRYVFNNNLDELIDRERGTADFDNEQFVQLLESMNFLPVDRNDDIDSPTEPELIGKGRQIMAMTSLMNTDVYQVYRKLFGGEIVFKGLPSIGSGGNLLTVYDGISMTVTCSDKDGAWEFIRFIATEDWQRRNFNRLSRGNSFFPINKAVFDDMIEEAMNEPAGSRKIGGWGWLDFEMDSVPLTQEEADHIRSLISGESWNTEVDLGLWNIVSEEAARYFRSQISAQEAARVIQNRASIYMSEQYGW